MNHRLEAVRRALAQGRLRQAEEQLDAEDNEHQPVTVWRVLGYLLAVIVLAVIVLSQFTMG